MTADLKSLFDQFKDLHAKLQAQVRLDFPPGTQVTWSDGTGRVFNGQVIRYATNWMTPGGLWVKTDAKEKFRRCDVFAAVQRVRRTKAVLNND